MYYYRYCWLKLYVVNHESYPNYPNSFQIFRFVIQKRKVEVVLTEMKANPAPNDRDLHVT